MRKQITADQIASLPSDWQNFARTILILPEGAVETLQEEALHGQIHTLLSDLATLNDALRESVKLQSHYAKLLNMYDGGKRMQFASGEDWIERLRVCREPTDLKGAGGAEPC